MSETFCDRAAQLVQLLLLLALLSFQDYVVSTWGPWLIAITLLIAPFWFNPQTFSLGKTTVRTRCRHTVCDMRCVT